MQADAGSLTVTSAGPWLLKEGAELCGATGYKSPAEKGALCQPLLELKEEKLALPRTHLPFIIRVVGLHLIRCRYILDWELIKFYCPFVLYIKQEY